MSRPEVKEVLTYLESWKSSSEIKAHFELTQNQWYNLCRWLTKGKFIKRTLLRAKNRPNTFYLYKKSD